MELFRSPGSNQPQPHGSASMAPSTKSINTVPTHRMACTNQKPQIRPFWPEDQRAIKHRRVHLQQVSQHAHIYTTTLQAPEHILLRAHIDIIPSRRQLAEWDDGISGLKLAAQCPRKTTTFGQRCRCHGLWACSAVHAAYCASSARAVVVAHDGLWGNKEQYWV